MFQYMQTLIAAAVLLMVTCWIAPLRAEESKSNVTTTENPVAGQPITATRPQNTEPDTPKAPISDRSALAKSDLRAAPVRTQRTAAINPSIAGVKTRAVRQFATVPPRCAGSLLCPGYLVLGIAFWKPRGSRPPEKLARLRKTQSPNSFTSEPATGDRAMGCVAGALLPAVGYTPS